MIRKSTWLDLTNKVLVLITVMGAIISLIGALFTFLLLGFVCY